VKTYLIDAYNLLYAFADIPSGSLQVKREALMRWIQDHRPQGRNAVMLVFDSRDGEGNRYSSADMQIVFTAGTSADDWISAHVRTTRRPAATVVVTNDQGLRRMVRGTGAKWMSCDEFLQLAAPPKKAVPSNAQNNAARDEITKDLMNEWL